MGYSTNPATAAKMRPYLEALAAGGEVKFRTSPNLSGWFAYKMREALSILRVRPGAAGVELPNDYSFKVVSSQEVLAIPVYDKRAEVVEDAAPVRSIADIRRALDIHDIRDRWESRGTEDRVYFPNAHLSPEDLTLLWEWAQDDGVIIFENAGAITLLPLAGNEELAELGWTPEDSDE